MKLSKEIKIKVNHKWNWKWISNDFLRHALSDQIQMLEFFEWKLQIEAKKMLIFEGICMTAFGM